MWPHARLVVEQFVPTSHPNPSSPMYAQLHSKHAPSHLEGGDDPDSTAHQDVPVVEPVKDAVPFQILEVTLIDMLILLCILIVHMTVDCF